MITPTLPRNICIYCGEHAGTRDHVPPRFLLERPFPPNLRTVPSCMRCNNGASRDEQYLLALIAHVATAPKLVAKLEPGGSIDVALTRSPALEKRLLAAIGVDEKTGTTYIRPETIRVNKVVKKIAVGLFALRYGRAPASDAATLVGLYPYDENRNQLPVHYFVATFTERFKTKRWRSVQNGVFSYIFVRDPIQIGKVLCVMDIHQSFWAVVHFPNPASVQKGVGTQRSLFPASATSAHVEELG